MSQPQDGFQHDALFLLLGGEPQTFAFSRFFRGVAKIAKLKHSQDFQSGKKPTKKQLINSNNTVLCIILVLLSN